jgi:hypothetical protein
MADNAFSVQVVNPLQALLIGQQSYSDANKTQARQDAAQAIAGGDYKTGLSKLLGIQDYQGATALSNMDNNAWSRQHTTSQDAINNVFRANADRRAGAAEGRAASEFDNTPDQYAPNPNAGQPGQSQYIDQYAAAARPPEKPFDVSVPGPFGSTSKQTVIRGPDGSIRPFRVDSGAPQADGGAFGGLGFKPAGWDNTAPQAATGAPQAASSFDQRFAAASPQSVAPSAAPGQSAPQSDLEAIDPKTGRRENWLKAQSPDEQGYLKKVADYEIDPRTSSTRGGQRERMMTALAHYAPEYDQNTFGSIAQAERAFGSGPQGNAIRSFDVSISHVDTLKKYIIALNSGDYPSINAIRNAWLQQTGSSLPTNVQAVGPIVGAEISKAIIGSNNAFADREELRKPLLGSGSTNQILGSIGAYQELMGGQLKGLKKQYEDTTHKKNFDSRISDNTKNILLGSQSSQDGSNVTSNGVKWSVQ